MRSNIEYLYETGTRSMPESLIPGEITSSSCSFTNNHFFQNTISDFTVALNLEVFMDLSITFEDTHKTNWYAYINLKGL